MMMGGLGSPWRRFIRTAMLLLLSSTCAVAEDSGIFWTSVVAKVGPMAMTNEDDRSVATARVLQTEVIGRLRVDGSLVPMVRSSLRNDQRASVRAFCAKTLIEAFGRDGAADDYVLILSDPDVAVRGWAVGSIRLYQIESAACSLGASLLSVDRAERNVALGRIIGLLSWKGLPYYRVLLDDPDSGIAARAAFGFRSCKKEDAVPHLLRYLRQYGRDALRDPVTVEVIQALYVLYDEALPADLDVRREADAWTRRLEKELGWTSSALGPAP